MDEWGKIIIARNLAAEAEERAKEAKKEQAAHKAFEALQHQIEEHKRKEAADRAQKEAQHAAIVAQQQKYAEEQAKFDEAKHKKTMSYKEQLDKTAAMKREYDNRIKQMEDYQVRVGDGDD